LACSGFRTYFSEIYKSIWTLGSILWTGDQPDARPLPTQDDTPHKNADTHPCLEWDPNPRSQCSSGRRQYVPQSARLLRSAAIKPTPPNSNWIYMHNTQTQARTFTSSMTSEMVQLFIGSYFPFTNVHKDLWI